MLSRVQMHLFMNKLKSGRRSRKIMFANFLTDMTEKLTDEEIIARQERLYELEIDCSTSKNLIN